MQASFGPFVLDTGTRQLLKSRREIHVAPKAFELLVALVQERPNVLSKAELQQRLWPETFVAAGRILSNLVAEIREALAGIKPARLATSGHGARIWLCVLRRRRRSDRRVVESAWLTGLLARVGDPPLSAH